MKDHVWLDIKKCQFVIVTNYQHGAFGCWFYPAHGMIYLGEL